MYRFSSIQVDDFYPIDFIYLDSAASALKPAIVCDVMHDFYSKNYSNIGRGMYARAYANTQKYIETKQKIQNFLNAQNYHVVYTLNATYALNIVSMMLKDMQNIAISTHEHHSNILPWRSRNVLTLPHENMAELRNIDIISMSHCCNVTGQIFPVEQIIKNTPNAIHIVDGAQIIPHQSVNIDAMNPDFYIFSPHKAYGPTGIGVLLIKKSMITKIQYPILGGGTVVSVSVENNDIIFEALEGYEGLEAGTPPIAQSFGMIAGIEYMQSIGMDNIQNHSTELRAHIISSIKNMPHITALNTSDQGAPTVSFIVNNMHSHDVGIMLSEQKIALRVGHMCAQPTINKYGYNDVIRISCGIYNDLDDIENFAHCIDKLKKYA